MMLVFLSSSTINKMMQTSSIPACITVLVEGQKSVSVCLLGDAEYPHLHYIMSMLEEAGRQRKMSLAKSCQQG